MCRSAGATRGAELCLHCVWRGTGFYFPADLVGIGQRSELWPKTEIPHAGGGQPLGPAVLVSWTLAGSERLRAGPYPATDS